MVADPAGRILLVNRVARELLDLPDKPDSLNVDETLPSEVRRQDGSPLPPDEGPSAEPFGATRWWNKKPS